MPQLKHSLTGALYSLVTEGEYKGLVRVENNGLVGFFAAHGGHQHGELKQADPHMILWLGGPQLPVGAMVRRNR